MDMDNVLEAMVMVDRAMQLLQGDGHSEEYTALVVEYERLERLYAIETVDGGF